MGATPTAGIRVEHRMGRKIVCELCGLEVVATSSTQKTCLSEKCKRKWRSNYRKRYWIAGRKPPTCVWCHEPILEPRKRGYHPDCRADKNRLRVRHYNQTHKIRPVTSQKRRYAGTITCLVCGMTVPKTGARQIVCVDKKCQAALKLRNKRAANERRRVMAAIRAEKAARCASKKPQPDFLADVFRLTL